MYFRISISTAYVRSLHWFHISNNTLVKAVSLRKLCHSRVAQSLSEIFILHQRHSFMPCFHKPPQEWKKPGLPPNRGAHWKKGDGEGLQVGQHHWDVGMSVPLFALAVGMPLPDCALK